ncbi:MAG: DUF2878 domain-containing protein [Pseudomonadales bacterium]|nr:DUF2878 domain-containing protein [Pseudomonadales bacterium]
MSKPFNLVAFNLMWLGCVVGREQWFVLVAPLVIAYAALLLSQDNIKPSQILVPIGIGICIDSALTLLGVFEFERGSLIAPLWLMVLWIAFSTALVKSLAIFGRNKLLAAALGAIAFPLNYSVGERLGAVSFAEGYFTAVIALSVIWAICLPLLYYIAEGSLEKRHATS